jgi:hypothetical protein
VRAQPLRISERTGSLLNQRAAVAVGWFGFGGDFCRCGYSVSWLQLQLARRGGNAADVCGCPPSRIERGKGRATGLMILSAEDGPPGVLLIRLVSGKSESNHGIAQRGIRIGLAAERHGNVLASVYHVNHRRGGRGTRSFN